jgi:hypothetical protein
MHPHSGCGIGTKLEVRPNHDQSALQAALSTCDFVRHLILPSPLASREDPALVVMNLAVQLRSMAHRINADVVTRTILRE